MLKINDLWVNVDGKEILKGVNLEIGERETHALIGANASGKTTLVLTIMGYPSYEVTRGDILFKGEELKDKPIEERARKGIGCAFQHSPEVRGVKLRDVIRLCGGLEPWDPLREGEEAFASEILKRVGLGESFKGRDLNLGFSGGERRRSELAQILAMRPKLMILDEPDSGVDIDSIKLIGEELRRAVQELESSVLVITHHRHILQYLKADIVHVMDKGRIVISGDPDEIIAAIEEKGYERYLEATIGFGMKREGRGE